MTTDPRLRRAFTRRRVRSTVASLLVFAVAAAACTSTGGGDADREGVAVRSPLPCDIAGCVGEGVETGSGAYTVVVEDVAFPPGLFGVELVRSYRSDRSEVGLFGRGWSSVYETRLIDTDDGKLVDAPAGLAPLWAPEAPEQWAVAGAPTLMSISDTERGLRWPSGETWTFDAEGLLAVVSSPYDEAVTVDRELDQIRLRSTQGLTVELTLDSAVVTEAILSDGRGVSFGYDGDRLTEVTAPGWTSTYRYDDDGQIVEHATPSGTTVTSYDDGRVVDQTTTAGDRLALSYDGTTTTVRSEDTLRYDHDDDGRLIRITRGEAEVMVRRFDAGGRLVAATDYTVPTGEVLRSIERTYTGDRLTTEVVNGVETAITYDDAGRVVEVDGPEPVTFGYGDGPLPVIVTTPIRGEDRITYDSGLVSSVVDATGVTSTTVRDQIGNPISHAAVGDLAWSYEFDAEGNITATTSPTGRRWTARWGPRSTLLEERDPAGRVSRYRYDDAGRLLTERLPGVPPTRRDYDDTGRLITVISPDGLVTIYGYDQGGQLDKVILPGEQIWQIDTARPVEGGTVTTVTAPDGVRTVTTRDSAGRDIERRAVEPDGRVVETVTVAYDYDRPTTTLTRRGASTLISTIAYDDAGRIVETRDDLDGVDIAATTYGYTDGRLDYVDNGITSAEYEHDPAGRITQIISNDDVWEGAYRNGQLATARHNDTVTQIGYDADGRAVTFTDHDGMTTTWTYDDVDQPIGRSIGESTSSFDWTPAGLLAGYRSSTGAEWSWTWDDAGRLLQADEPGQVVTTYTHDNGAVTRIRTEGSDSDRDDTFTYDARGLLQSIDSDTGDFDYTYDATGRLSSVDGDNTETWTYNAAGLVTTVQTGDDVYALDYDPDGRLRQITGPDDRLDVAWSDTAIESVEVTNRDPLRLRTDPDGRLRSVSWDYDTAIDVAWTDEESFEVRGRGGEQTQRYGVINGVLESYQSDAVSYTSTRQDSGYLDTVQVRSNDLDGDIRFDELGRPSTLIAGDATSTIAYGPAGTVSSVLTSSPDEETSETTITYSDDGRSVDGDDGILDALFDNDGVLRPPVPSALADPFAASGNSVETQAEILVAEPRLLDTAEPRPFDALNAAIVDSTPRLTTPIGVNDLGELAERIIAAEVTRLSPTVAVNGDVTIRVPVVDTDDGTVVQFDPFLDAAPAAQALDVLVNGTSGDPSIISRAAGAIGDVIVGAIGLGIEVATFIVTNPIARLVVSTGAVVAAAVACAPGNVACLPLALLATGLLATDGVLSLATSVPGLLRSCPDGELAQCGLLIADSALAVAQLVVASNIASSVIGVALAERALSRAIGSGTGTALASGRVGTARAELLATLRFQRVVGRERPVCIDQVCARIDLVTKPIGRRARLIEVKNGTAARLTTNQTAVYPMLSERAAYFPVGLRNGGSPETIRATVVDIQHFGTRLPLTLP